MKVNTPLLRLAVLAIALAMAPSAFAQAWPTKPVRLVAAFPPGTPGDVIARLIQPALQAAWNQSVVVENKTGAGGNLAAGEVAQAKDGHTLLVGPDTILTINPHLYKKLGFDPRASLKPVTYYNKLPIEPRVSVVLVLDPMLATGGSAVATIDILKQWGAKRIKYVGLIAAPEVIARLREAHPDVPIHVGAIDERLSREGDPFPPGYIMPGLGDAGDRQFGTG